MAKTKAQKSVTVRTAEDLGHALGLSMADIAELEFRSELIVALAKIKQRPLFASLVYGCARRNASAAD